jgi:putative tryptophan/tyrosine transport system substrate-binding protein
MRRRFALSLLAGALAAPASARLALAQTGPRIVILHSGWPDRSPTHILIQYLRELGYEDGRTAKIEIHGAEGDRRGWRRSSAASQHSLPISSSR